MAEKEQRIYLFTDKIICENCKDWYEHIDPLDSPDCSECAPANFPYITRTEAIERMAKAIDYNLNGSSFNSLAEAVLNALLGESND